MGVAILITNADLSALLGTLTPARRQTIEELLKGKRSDESAAVLRWIRRRLKRRVRGKKK
jgi:hypothetical protein